MTTASFLRRVLMPVQGEQQAAVVRELDEAGGLTTDYLLLVILSCVIATFGLMLNSPAVIIGAMLIAPLMSPIARGSLALVRGDLRRGRLALGTLLVGVLTAIALSAFFGMLVPLSGANLVSAVPSEILSRTHPTLFDLIVALAGGAAVAYALARPNLSATLPGVAIATALMPPLCTVGIGFAQHRPDISAGALLLFLANLAAIVFASSLVFVVLGFHPTVIEDHRGRLLRTLMIEGFLLLVIAVPLTRVMVGIVQDAQTNETVSTTLVTDLDRMDHATLADFQLESQPKYLQIVATVRAPHTLTYDEVVQMQRDLAIHLQRTVALKLIVVPMTVLDPLIPPTPTPTPTPKPTPTRAPTSTPAPSPTTMTSPGT